MLHSRLAVCRAALCGTLLAAVCGEVLHRASAEQHEPHRIAIIGAGISGASAAHFLSQLTDGRALLDVYERGRVGGRLASALVAGKRYETGGCVVHPENRYMSTFVRELGLAKNEGCPGNFGLFDGREVVLADSSWKAVFLTRVLWRYGVRVYLLFRELQTTLDRFGQVYALQDRGLAFNATKDLLHGMHPTFPGLTRQSVEAHLAETGVPRLAVEELVRAAGLVNYAQDETGLHAFVGLVATAGAVPGLWAVQGGAQQVPEQLISKSRAALLHRAVTDVAAVSPSLFRVTSVETAIDDVKTQEYDAVIIATPLTSDVKANITFTNTTKDFEFPGRYQRVYANLIYGKPRYETFGIKESEHIADILSVNSSLFYNSLSRLYPVDDTACEAEDPGYKNGSSVYKVFSRAPLSESELAELFSEVHETHVRSWLAYPQYTSLKEGADLGRFTLQPGLYHTGAVEWAASAMEMGAISGRNVALLALKHLTKDARAGDQWRAREEL